MADSSKAPFVVSGVGEMDYEVRLRVEEELLA
jgi:hypothetical protein